MAGLFDKQASVYASSRPSYPAELYDFLHSLTAHHDLVWDVGTGNGQAAVQLAERFDHVIATDISEQQVAHAQRRPNVTYVATPTLEDAKRAIAEHSGGLPVDLITVAQALHWFDFDAFYAIAKSVLRTPGGVVAAWTYDVPDVPGCPAVNAATARFYKAIGPYWHPARAYVDRQYRTIPFPFSFPRAVKDSDSHSGSDERKRFPFRSCIQLDLHRFMEYLRSWSAVQTALDSGIDFLAAHSPEFQAAWHGGPESVKEVVWPIHLIVGEV